MEFDLTDLLGMTGTALVVIAYLLLQLERIAATSLTYNTLNLISAILLLISLCVNFNLASFVIELFWIAASLIGLYKYVQRRQQTNQAS
ncbi:hypothetical protein [Halioglobus sp. HI00S01]|uniref:CBU_0592 family membrane protein n=1 Tax=Halioglobus sp. HI00S01 TaxID=1822214 RepID=UPI000A59A167|nr:hypothetical protein [Halioglobus sp. HI00S01]